MTENKSKPEEIPASLEQAINKMKVDNPKVLCDELKTVKSYPRQSHYFAYRVRLGDNNQESFALLPLSNDAAYIRGIFSVEARYWLLHSHRTSDVLQLIPKINEFGEQEGKGNKRRVERRTIETNYEYQLSKPEDIEWFVHSYVVNAIEFMDFYKSLPEPTVISELGRNTDPQDVGNGNLIITQLSDKELLPTE